MHFATDSCGKAAGSLEAERHFCWFSRNINLCFHSVFFITIDKREENKGLSVGCVFLKVYCSGAFNIAGTLSILQGE